MSGYIIAIRRGFFRRLLYTSIGGLGVASICYPKEAEQYWQQSLNETKTYATILYNFAYGGKATFRFSLSLECLIDTKKKTSWLCILANEINSVLYMKFSSAYVCFFVEAGKMYL